MTKSNLTYILFCRTLPSGQRCFIMGTDASQTPKTAEKCRCTPNYHGVDCGIPDSVWHGLYVGSKRLQEKLQIRPQMRRLIHAVPVNHEFDLFEARVNMLKEVVDVYLIQESNYTAYGSPKDLLFIDRFKNGWLTEEQVSGIFFLSHEPIKYLSSISRPRFCGYFCLSFLKEAKKMAGF